MGGFFGFLNSYSYHGASISGGYWRLLGALTPFAYWGAREGIHSHSLRYSFMPAS